MRLTEQQRLAAEATGSVAVTAGAGTGKTTMLAARYLHHITTDGFSPLEIVAVTFTEKAAAELRSRIRRVLREECSSEEMVAEVEAAQISTMHSLASRICRDFYDLAGIPADFTVLDETESPVWLTEKFEEAVSAIQPEIIDQLGFTWLTNALRELLRDPIASENALKLGADHWRAFIEQESKAALDEFVSCVAWNEAHSTIRDIGGRPGDKLEDARTAAIAAMDDIISGGNIPTAMDTLSRMSAHLGQAGNWGPGEKDVVGR